MCIDVEHKLNPTSSPWWRWIWQHWNRESVVEHWLTILFQTIPYMPEIVLFEWFRDLSYSFQWHLNFVTFTVPLGLSHSRATQINPPQRFSGAWRNCSYRTWLFCTGQPAPEYRTKGCSHSSADSPGARALVFAAFEPSHSCEFRTWKFANTLLRDTLALSHFVSNQELWKFENRHVQRFADNCRKPQIYWVLSPYVSPVRCGPSSLLRFQRTLPY